MTESTFHLKTQCLTCERRGGNSAPNIFSERNPPSPHHLPLVWRTFGLHPVAEKQEVWGKGWAWGEGGKKNREMFSSGCNLSLSCLQHSWVILQHSPARRTEVALCLGLTQAHIHLKPLLSLGCHSLRCRHAAAAELRAVIYVFFQWILCSQFRHPEQWSIEFYPVKLLSDVPPVNIVSS